MSREQLIEIMKFHLGNFNDEGVSINVNTIHNSVLSDSDGFGNSNSKNIYKALIRWTLRKNDQSDIPWPKVWINMSIKDLAVKLIK